MLALLDLNVRAIYLPSDHVPSKSEERFWMAHDYGHPTMTWTDESETNVDDWMDGEEDLSPYWGIDQVESGSWLDDLDPSFEVTDSSIFADPPFTITAKPPANAEFLLSFFVKNDELDAIIGDLTERYVSLFELLGKRKADLHIYIDVARSLYHLSKHALVKTGVMVLLGQWIKKLIS